MLKNDELMPFQPALGWLIAIAQLDSRLLVHQKTLRLKPPT